MKIFRIASLFDFQIYMAWGLLLQVANGNISVKVEMRANEAVPLMWDNLNKIKCKKVLAFDIE